MTKTQIMEELKKLSPEELLTVVEAALRQIRRDLKETTQPLSQTENKRQLAIAAEALFADYATDRELTTFTSLDAEDFHA